MDQRERLICASDALLDGGKAASFTVPFWGEGATGFAVRFNGKVYGYLNRCAHVPVPMDWEEGEFFDLTRQYLICATHGAHYEPDSGICVMGPCGGKRLQKVNVVERDGNVYLIELELK